MPVSIPSGSNSLLSTPRTRCRLRHRPALPHFVRAGAAWPVAAASEWCDAGHLDERPYFAASTDSTRIERVSRKMRSAMPFRTIAATYQGLPTSATGGAPSSCWPVHSLSCREGPTTGLGAACSTPPWPSSRSAAVGPAAKARVALRLSSLLAPSTIPAEPYDSGLSALLSMFHSVCQQTANQEQFAAARSGAGS